MSNPPDQTDETKERILAVDLGQKRVGLAVSDPLGTFAVGLETLTATSKSAVIDHIADLCRSYGVVTVVVGLPVHMNGTEGEKAAESRRFAEGVRERIGVPVEFVDERLTTVIAQQTLREQGLKPSRQKGLVDQAAACLILQHYLDRRQSRP